VAGESWQLELRIDNHTGHRLPTGVSNLRELWLEVVVRVDGEEVHREGALAADGALPPTAFRLGKWLADAEGVPLLRHEVWRVARVLRDTTVAPGRATTHRVELLIPEASGVEVEARLRYRSLGPQHSQPALGEASELLRVVDVATAEASWTVTPSSGD
jgi:hypothetical protein